MMISYMLIYCNFGSSSIPWSINRHQETQTLHTIEKIKVTRNQSGNIFMMNVEEVLHMVGGAGETSYALNSKLQVLPKSVNICVSINFIHACMHARA